MILRKRVVTLHQLELTSRCSLACRYCPSPKMGKVAGYRGKRDMSEEVFRACLEWLRFFCRKGTQGEVNLAGIGESMMRDDFEELAARVREVVGPVRKLLLATNGLHMTEERAKELARLDVRVWISLHRPEKAGLAVDIAKRAGILDGVSNDPSLNPNTWAGQVDWVQTAERSYCAWFRHGWGFVTSEGGLTSCCLDATGATVCGSVLTDQPGEFEIKSTKLCSTCDRVIDVVPGFDQSKAGEP
jgi:hypothetical protein